MDLDRVGIGKDVILLGGAPRIFALAHGRIPPWLAVGLVAVVVEGLGGLAELALLVAGPGGRGTPVRSRGVLAVGIVEPALEARDDIRRQCAARIAADGIVGSLVQRE